MQSTVAGVSGHRSLFFRNTHKGRGRTLGAMWIGKGAKLVAALGVALLAANCSSSKVASVDSKYGVAASPLRYAEGDEIPKGGGRYQTGRPYTIAGKMYYPKEDPSGYRVEGVASWYGPGFHGRQTANGEYFDQHSLAAAHPTLPLPSYVRVTNLDNSRSIVVRVNDRGPFSNNRVLDVSRRTAEVLDFINKGTTRVRVEYLGKASVSGSDDSLLLASLTTDGSPAQLKRSTSTMLADAGSVATPRQTLAFASQTQTHDLSIPRSLFSEQSAELQQPDEVASSDEVELQDVAPLPPRRPVQ